MACPPLPLSPSNNLNKRVNRSGLATQFTPVVKSFAGSLKHSISPTPTEPDNLQITVGTEAFPAILDGQAAPFFPVQENIL
eukprot:c30646_g1_i1 orf=23-265(+)